MLAAILGFIALAWRLDRAATWPFRALCRLGGLCGAAERLDLDDELRSAPTGSAVKTDPAYPDVLCI
jgi:hypothetical protein